ncbi:hypothetical protein CEW92_00595 [Bacillaceae bacterium SAS-127]|nr:hypothetical protein CEW92_00595 [Bacillaceae bacterium SAS-127]
MVAAAICLFVSLSFELIQLITGWGATDIDDLILNTIGGVIGVFIYTFLLKGLDKKAQISLATLLFLVVFGICGKMSLYLYAPNILPAEVVYENEAVFKGGEKDSYDLSALCVGIRDGVIYLEEGSINAEQMKSQQDPKEQYTLSDDAVLIIKRMAYQYSPNGNIQKTTVSYTSVDEKSAMEIVKVEENGFVDLWINDDNECEMFVFTVYEGK